MVEYVYAKIVIFNSKLCSVFRMIDNVFAAIVIAQSSSLGTDSIFIGASRDFAVNSLHSGFLLEKHRANMQKP